MEILSMGLWGHPDVGSAFDHRGYDGIKRIIIFSGHVVDSIKIQYKKKNGKHEWTDRIGGDGGDFHEIVLDDHNEYLTAVIGHYGYGRFLGQGSINSLIFFSNLKRYGRYGLDKGSPFPKESDLAIAFYISGGKIVGFQGTAGRSYLSSIGFHVIHTAHSPLLHNVFGNLPFSRMPKQKGGSETNQGDGVMGTISMGLWGCPDVPEGLLFNHEGYDGIKRIIVSHASGGVDSIKVQYTKNGMLEWTDKTGEDDDDEADEVILDAPDEYLTMVTGHYGSRLIYSLTLVSNRKRYGPFGNLEGNTFEVTGGKVVGFQGVGGKHIFAIGFHVMHTSAPSPSGHASGSTQVESFPLGQDDKEISQLQDHAGNLEIADRENAPDSTTDAGLLPKSSSAQIE